jgi:hydrogenase/urease accessory protein HupE
LRLAALVAGFALFGANLLAHDPGFSTLNVRLHPDRVEAHLVLALLDVESFVPLDNDFNGHVSAEEFAYGRSRLTNLAGEAVLLQFDQRTVLPAPPEASVDESNNVSFRLIFPGQATNEIRVQSAILSLVAPGHRQLLTLEDASGHELTKRFLNEKDDTFVWPLVATAGGAAPPGVVRVTFWEFLKFGVEHILIGYDHLAFLLGLLLVTRRFLPALQVITCFTLAHSVTLGLAALNVVNLPSRIVEPLIAASIAYVGVENIWRKGDPHGRWRVTLCFGLIHGFGFASVLRDKGLGGGVGGIALPLFSFNLGVEVGQLMVAALLLPVVWSLHRWKPFPRYGVPALSALLTVLGLFWLVQRVWLPA